MMMNFGNEIPIFHTFGKAKNRTRYSLGPYNPPFKGTSSRQGWKFKFWCYWINWTQLNSIAFFFVKKKLYRPVRNIDDLCHAIYKLAMISSSPSQWHLLQWECIASLLPWN